MGGDMELHELPHVSDDHAEEGAVEPEPAVLCIPLLLDGEIVLPALVVVVHPGGDAEVGRHDSRAGDVPCKNVSMLISPTLDVRGALGGGARTNSGHKEEDLALVVLVPDGKQLNPIDLVEEDELGACALVLEVVLEELLGEACMGGLDAAHELVAHLLCGYSCLDT